MNLRNFADLNKSPPFCILEKGQQARIVLKDSPELRKN